MSVDTLEELNSPWETESLPGENDPQMTYRVLIPVQTFECYIVEAHNTYEARELVALRIASQYREKLQESANALPDTDTIEYHANPDMLSWHVEEMT